MEVRRNYRIIVYSGVWYVERLKTPGVWEILSMWPTEAEAESKLKKLMEVDDANF